MMKKIAKINVFILLIAVFVSLFAACGITGIPVPTKAGEEFTLGDETYILEKWIRVPENDTFYELGYGLCLMKTKEEAPIKFTDDGSCVSMINISLEIDGKYVSADNIGFEGVDDVDGYKARATFYFNLPRNAFPEIAIASYESETTTVELDLRDVPLPEDIIPAEMIGNWWGTCVPEGAPESSRINLDITIFGDSTGEYTFTQGDYVESEGMLLEYYDKTFSLCIREDNTLGITKTEGTYTYSDGILSLDIITYFSNESTFSYKIDCVKQE